MMALFSSILLFAGFIGTYKCLERLVSHSDEAPTEIDKVIFRSLLSLLAIFVAFVFMFLLYAFKSCTDDTGYLAYPTEADMKNGQVFAILATFHRAEEGGPKKIGLLQKVSVKTDVSRQTFSYEILNESPRHYQLEWQKYDGVTNLVAIKKDGLVTLVPYPLKPELEPKEVSPKSMEEEDVEKE